MDTPLAAIWPTSSYSSPTMSGASPIDNSSIRRIAGSVASPRAIASICCSPPDNVPATWRTALFESREAVEGTVEDLVPCAREREHAEVLAHGEVAEHTPALGNRAHADPGECIRGDAVDVPATDVHAADIGGHLPVRHLQRGGLPGAVRPEQRDDLAGRHREVHAVQDLDPPVAGPHAAQLEQRLRFGRRRR